jgi:hypothetical protein
MPPHPQCAATAFPQVGNMALDTSRRFPLSRLSSNERHKAVFKIAVINRYMGVLEKSQKFLDESKRSANTIGRPKTGD